MLQPTLSNVADTSFPDARDTGRSLFRETPTQGIRTEPYSHVAEVTDVTSWLAMRQNNVGPSTGMVNTQHLSTNANMDTGVVVNGRHNSTGQSVGMVNAHHLSTNANVDAGVVVHGRQTVAGSHMVVEPLAVALHADATGATNMVVRSPGDAHTSSHSTPIMSVTPVTTTPQALLRSMDAAELNREVNVHPHVSTVSEQPPPRTEPFHDNTGTPVRGMERNAKGSVFAPESHSIEYQRPEPSGNARRSRNTTVSFVLPQDGERQPLSVVGTERETAKVASSNAVTERQRSDWQDRVAPFASHLQHMGTSQRNPHLFSGPR